MMIKCVCQKLLFGGLAIENIEKGKGLFHHGFYGLHGWDFGVEGGYPQRTQSDANAGFMFQKTFTFTRHTVAAWPPLCYNFVLSCFWSVLWLKKDIWA